LQPCKKLSVAIEMLLHGNDTSLDGMIAAGEMKDGPALLTFLLALRFFTLANID
jgi:hypothetical protein